MINCTYPSEYQGPNPIAEQITAIARIFGLDATQALQYVKKLTQLPAGAEGWFAIPSVNALAAKHFPQLTDPADQYCAAFWLVYNKIAKARLCDEWGVPPTSQTLRLTSLTARMLKLVAKKQPGDILIIAAQLGLRYRYRSVRQARHAFVANEFGLGSVAFGSILLTHPKRLVNCEQLQVFCAGDKFAHRDDGRFVGAPSFAFSEYTPSAVDADGPSFTYGAVGLWFGSGDITHARPDFGSASGFLPQ